VQEQQEHVHVLPTKQLSEIIDAGEEVCLYSLYSPQTLEYPTPFALYMKQLYGIIDAGGERCVCIPLSSPRTLNEP
jgi:hypothetical protein